MEIKLVSHASVVITCSGIGIWTDPWTVGGSFNNSWSLWPPAVPPDLERINFIWLSHEHPDHLSFPTLAALPMEVRKRITVMCQLRGAIRIFEALKPLGFQCFRMLPHREQIRLTSRVAAYTYEVGTLDSCLAIISEGQTAVNVNDARLNQTDYQRMLRDIGPADVVLNQFSIAVKDPIVDYAARARGAAQRVLQSLVDDHRGLQAKVTIPFASLMYFSAIDNAHMNVFRNTPQDAYDYCRSRDCEVVVLYPGDNWIVGRSHNSTGALARYEAAYEDLEEVALSKPPAVSLEQLGIVTQDLVANLYSRYPTWVLRRFPPLYIRVPDLDCVVALDLGAGELTRAAAGIEPDAEIYSQPLHYALEQTWGWGTLASSGRFTLLRHSGRWRAYKSLFALHNAGVFVYPWRLHKTWAYAKCRVNVMARYRERSR